MTKMAAMPVYGKTIRKWTNFNKTWNVALWTRDVYINYDPVVTLTYFTARSDYCLNTIFQKLHFSKSHFSERRQEKYEQVTILHSKSPKKATKILKIG